MRSKFFYTIEHPALILLMIHRGEYKGLLDYPLLNYSE